MKRDLELVRRILLRVEEADGPLCLDDLASGKYPEEVVAYHVGLMAARGLIDAEVSREWDGSFVDATIDGLTWDGQDFLDALRDERVWSKARKAISESVGSTTFEVVKAVAIKCACEILGVNPV